MASAPKWIPELFENSLDGVSSAVTPELIQPTQLAWGKNIINRGAKPGTRPSFRFLCSLPSGLVQGVSYFGVQGGMGVISIDGNIYRLRINPNDASFEQLSLPWRNSALIKQVYMQQTVETLVIQDGQSDPILYNGSTAVRSVPSAGGVPLGRQMAYGNGRLWVAINGKELVAGDIRQNIIGSELLFTETNYLSGGGTFFFPRGITGLNFIATTGTSDYGALLIFGSDFCDSLRADITFRDLWAQTPGFITSVLRHTGCASHWSLGQVNQDLFWRDASGGIRSIRSSLADESGSGNAPISREVSRLTDYDSPQLLEFCSSISFNNRLLVTSSPRLNAVGGVTWGNLISLDFAPVSTMRGKTMPAYDGQWSGLNFTHLFQGQFSGKSRAFAITLDNGVSNSLWELNWEGRGTPHDSSVICSNGTGLPAESEIICSIEYGRRSFGNSSLRKRLERCDVYLSQIEGPLTMKVYWRGDNNQKWQQWDEVEVCAKTSEPEDPAEAVHVWANLLPQQRPQIKTFTIPSQIDAMTKFSLITGFEFQIRLVWEGKCRIYKTILYASVLDNPVWAERELLSETCIENDVTGNEAPANYEVATSPCPVPEESIEMETHMKSGLAVLCGFSEFGAPSIPPKKYLSKTTAGSLSICSFAGDGAEFCAFYPPGANSLNLSGVFNIDGPGTITITSTITFDSYDPDTGLVHFDVVSTGVVLFYDGSGGPVTVNVEGGPGDFIGHTLPPGTWQLCARAVFGLGNPYAVCGDIHSSAVFPADTQLDEYNRLEAYDADTCIVVDSNNNLRTANGSSFDCPAANGTVSGFSETIDQYGSQAPVFVVGNTLRRVAPTGCNAGVYVGTVGVAAYEQLGGEDTEAAAIARALEGIPIWSDCAEPHDCTAYIEPRGAGDFDFLFSSSQVRAHMVGMQVFRTYKTTIQFYRRHYGSSGLFTFQSSVEILFTPTTSGEAASHFTDWVDVPNASGYETRAQSAQMEEN